MKLADYILFDQFAIQDVIKDKNCPQLEQWTANQGGQSGTLAGEPLYIPRLEDLYCPTEIYRQFNFYIAGVCNKNFLSSNVDWTYYTNYFVNKKNAMYFDYQRMYQFFQGLPLTNPTTDYPICHFWKMQEYSDAKPSPFGYLFGTDDYVEKNILSAAPDQDSTFYLSAFGSTGYTYDNKADAWNFNIRTNTFQGRVEPVDIREIYYDLSTFTTSLSDEEVEWGGIDIMYSSDKPYYANARGAFEKNYGTEKYLKYIMRGECNGGTWNTPFIYRDQNDFDNDTLQYVQYYHMTETNVYSDGTTDPTGYVHDKYDNIQWDTPVVLSDYSKAFAVLPLVDARLSNFVAGIEMTVFWKGTYYKRTYKYEGGKNVPYYEETERYFATTIQFDYLDDDPQTPAKFYYPTFTNNDGNTMYRCVVCQTSLLEFMLQPAVIAQRFYNWTNVYQRTYPANVHQKDVEGNITGIQSELKIRPYWYTWYWRVNGSWQVPRTWRWQPGWKEQNM